MKITLHRSTSSPSEFKSTQPLSVGMTHDAGDGAGSTVFVIYYKIEVCGQKKKNAFLKHCTVNCKHSWKACTFIANIHGMYVAKTFNYILCQRQYYVKDNQVNNSLVWYQIYKPLLAEIHCVWVLTQNTLRSNGDHCLFLYILQALSSLGHITHSNM